MLDSPSHLGGRSSLRKESALCSVSEGVPVRWTTGVCPFRLTVCVAVCVLRVGCERRQRDRGAAAGALLGAWLGAFVIPLDWDRAWQVSTLQPLIETIHCGHLHKPSRTQLR